MDNQWHSQTFLAVEMLHPRNSDILNDQGIKALYLKHRNGDVMAFIVGNEVFDHLEKVVDRFEDVANRISGIVVEQV